MLSSQDLENRDILKFVSPTFAIHHKTVDLMPISIFAEHEEIRVTVVKAKETNIIVEIRRGHVRRRFSFSDGRIPFDWDLRLSA